MPVATTQPAQTGSIESTLASRAASTFVEEAQALSIPAGLWHCRKETTMAPETARPARRRFRTFPPGGSVAV
jgi:hypothetical protein